MRYRCQYIARLFVVVNIIFILQRELVKDIQQY